MRGKVWYVREGHEAREGRGVYMVRDGACTIYCKDPPVGAKTMCRIRWFTSFSNLVHAATSVKPSTSGSSKEAASSA